MKDDGFSGRAVFAFLVGVALSWPMGVGAQAGHTEHTLRDDGSERPAASVAEVAWLAGQWTGVGLGAVAEEVWLPAVGGAMVGVFRLAGGDRVQVYEIMTLVEEGGSLVLRLKHFNDDLTGWEAADETVDFPLLRVVPDTLWFDGLTIAREGGSRMTVWVALESRGEVSEGEFRYRRARPETP